MNYNLRYPEYPKYSRTQFMATLRQLKDLIDLYAKLNGCVPPGLLSTMDDIKHICLWQFPSMSSFINLLYTTENRKDD